MTECEYKVTPTSFCPADTVEPVNQDVKIVDLLSDSARDNLLAVNERLGKF
jgi:hypothetical protein